MEATVTTGEELRVEMIETVPTVRVPRTVLDETIQVMAGVVEDYPELEHLLTALRNCN